MGVLITMLCLVLIAVIVGKILDRLDDKAVGREIEKINHKQYSPPADPFSVSEYLARIEKVHLDIERKKANSEDYVIILWLGLNGLCVSDGEWIKREEDLAGSGGNGASGYNGNGADGYTIPFYPIYQTYSLTSYCQSPYYPLTYPYTYPVTQLMDTQSLMQQQVNVAQSLQTQALLASLNTAVDFTGTNGR